MADFVRAIIHPKIAFKGLRQDLIDGNPVLDLQGKPCNARGGFGCVIKYETFCPKKVWAIKCYNVLPPGLEDHYLEITKYLEASPVNRYFLEISFSKAGIKVGGKVYPILKMEWSDGVDLHHYISKNINAPNKLKMLVEEWLKVCNHLTIHGVAHGDIQHGNVHVCENNGRIAIKIIDYDSLFFTASGSIHKDIIKGMEGYQHPKRRDWSNLLVNDFCRLSQSRPCEYLRDKHQRWLQPLQDEWQKAFQKIINKSRQKKNSKT